MMRRNLPASFLLPRRLLFSLPLLLVVGATLVALAAASGSGRVAAARERRRDRRLATDHRRRGRGAGFLPAQAHGR